MAKNNLTPEQDIATREFWALVASKETQFPDDPAGWTLLRGFVLQLLNYDITTEGHYVDRDKIAKTYKYGSLPTADLPCEWESDYRRALEAVNANQSTTSSGEPTEDTPIREAVLPEDV